MYKLLRFPHNTIQITFTMHAENSLYFTKTVYSCYINVTASYQILGLRTLPVQLHIMHDEITLVIASTVSMLDRFETPKYSLKVFGKKNFMPI